MMAERRRRKTADEGRQHLIDATLKCLSIHGYNGTSTRRIAEQAGTTAALVKHYFTGKSELIRECYRQYRQQEVSVFRNAAQAAGSDPVDQLEAYSGALFDIMADNSGTMRTLWVSFLEPVIQDPEIGKIQVKFHQMILSDYRDLIRAVHEKGHCSVSDATLEDQAYAINALLDGLWLEMSLDPGGLDVRRAQSVFKAVLGLLLNKPA